MKDLVNASKKLSCLMYANDAPMYFLIKNEIANVNHFCFSGYNNWWKFDYAKPHWNCYKQIIKDNGNSEINKCIYPQNILLTIYNSLFVSHINYGSLVWVTNISRISKI